jgi:translation initiation factor IF-2
VRPAGEGRGILGGRGGGAARPPWSQSGGARRGRGGPRPGRPTTWGRERGGGRGWAGRPAGPGARGRGGWAEMGGEGEREKKKVFPFLISIS